MNILFKVFNLIMVTFLVVSCQKRNDEDNPYEFGFTIDGQQHRHEKKESSGIIQGEFGFITADGIYHVTVYATDENGDFKILSMRNLRVSAPLDGSPLPPGAKIEGAAPGSPPASNQVQSQPRPNIPPPSNAVAPLGVNSPPVGQYSTQRPQFTTQPTIKPACAGCGYVTTQKPNGNKPPGFNFQTPEFQNPQSFNPQGPQVPQNIETFNPQGVQNPQNPSQPLVNDPSFIPQNPAAIQSPGVIQPGGGSVGGNPPGQNSGFGGVGGNFPQSNPQYPGEIPNRGGFPPQTPGLGGNNQGNDGFNAQNPSFGPGFVGDSGLVGNNNPGGGALTQANSGSYPDGGLSGSNPNLPGPFGGNPNQPQPQSPFSGLTVDKNVINVPNNSPIEIKDKYPGMSDGLPSGVKESDITDLLYKFHYEVGFHGHYEKGLKDGSKIGGYFVNGRDGVSRVVTYVADENGYHPKFKFIRLDADKTPNEATEKTFGLKSFEFVWYPIK